MEYKFYGWENADCESICADFSGNPRDLYDALSEIWCAGTCAPRLRERWTSENKTLGQCSITAFLVQDIFGGKVFGIERPDGNFHCYNVVGERVLDLTGEHVGDTSLVCDNNREPFRGVHFKNAVKFHSYQFVTNALLERRERG